MTDRIRGVYVTFDKDYRDDDAEPILDAIRMIKGVVDVSPHVTDLSDHDARMKVRYQFASDVLEPHKELTMTSPYRIPADIPHSPVKKVSPRKNEPVRVRDVTQLFQEIIADIERYGGPVLLEDDHRMLRVCYENTSSQRGWYITVRDIRRTCPPQLRPYFATAAGRQRVVYELWRQRGAPRGEETGPLWGGVRPLGA